jgi:hypothetical protein
MIRQKGTKHNYQQATGYWNVLPLTGILCPVSTGSFTIRFEKNDRDHRPGSVQT